MEWELGTLSEKLGGRLVGNGKRRICGVSSPGSPVEGCLVVAWDRKALDSIPAGTPVVAPFGWIGGGRDGIETEDPGRPSGRSWPFLRRRPGRLAESTKRPMFRQKPPWTRTLPSGRFASLRTGP